MGDCRRDGTWAVILGDALPVNAEMEGWISWSRHSSEQYGLRESRFEGISGTQALAQSTHCSLGARQAPSNVHVHVHCSLVGASEKASALNFIYVSGDEERLRHRTQMVCYLYSPFHLLAL